MDAGLIALALGAAAAVMICVALYRDEQAEFVQAWERFMAAGGFDPIIAASNEAAIDIGEQLLPAFAGVADALDRMVQDAKRAP